MSDGSTLALIYLGTLVTVIAYGLYNFGVSRIPVSQASAYINLIPVFAVILGFTILGERFTNQQKYRPRLWSSPAWWSANGEADQQHLKGKAPAFVFSEKNMGGDKENYLVFVTDPFFLLHLADCSGELSNTFLISDCLYGI